MCQLVGKIWPKTGAALGFFGSGQHIPNIIVVDYVSDY